MKEPMNRTERILNELIEEFSKQIKTLRNMINELDLPESRTWNKGCIAGFEYAIDTIIKNYIREEEKPPWED